MTDERLRQAQHDARQEAAPFVGLAALACVALAASSAKLNWRLYSENDWWVWLVLATPAAVLCVVFLLGFDRLGMRSGPRRQATVALLALLATANVVGVALVLRSLLGGHTAISGAQLLATAAVVLFVNVITFGLVFWEIDCGGPIRRAVSSDGRPTPDFQFPQDENPHLAPIGWAPALNDYLYIALTNSIAFSPTDAMPLSHRAKMVMGAESVIAAVTVLTVAARAVNILR